MHSFLFLFAMLAADVKLEVVSVERIWDEAPHSAFGDLIRHGDRWYAVFREGAAHVPKTGGADDGRVRVISSADGAQWSSLALIAEPGIDLRDPHLSVAPDGRLMIVAGGSEYPGGVYQGRQSRVMFSRDGRHWTVPQKVLQRGHWLWRVTWHKGVGWGVTKYGSPSRELGDDPRKADLVRSSDGVHWETVRRLAVPGSDETAVRFAADDRMVVLMRTRSQQDEMVSVGWSDPPYQEWHFTKQGVFVGGPNFIVLPDGVMIGGGRWTKAPGADGPRTGVGPMTLSEYRPQIALPSGGDNSYPGFVWHDGLLWTLYYSSHEQKTAIYLAKLRVRK